MTGLYLMAASAGLAWAAIAFLMGHAGAHGADGQALDAGGHDFDAGGHDLDAGGHAADASAHSPEPGLPLLSPTVIASYVAGFGFTGLMARYGLGLDSALLHLPLAILGGGGLGLFMAWVLKRFVRGAETTSAAPVSEFVGLEAEVITPIAPGGFGEIAFEHNGTRFTGSARALDGDLHPQNETVLIAEVGADGTYHVERVSPGRGRRAAPSALASHR